MPQKSDAYYLPLLFREWLRVKGSGNSSAFIAQKNLQPFKPVAVKYLGVWDTVMALGSRLHATGVATSDKKRAFFAGDTPSTCVARARQALAVDEHRFDFRPEVWRDALTNQKVEQRWFAGVHSNVGGGYQHDGLANIALKWIVDGAKEEQLEIDQAFIAHFKEFPGDTLYESSTPFYKVLDFARSAMGRGRRKIHGYNADLAPTVIKRMTAEDTRDENGNKVKTPYRPEGVMRFLAEQPDVAAYLQKIGAADKPLPSDVMQQIEKFRKELAAAPPSLAISGG